MANHPKKPKAPTPSAPPAPAAPEKKPGTPEHGSDADTLVDFSVEKLNEQLEDLEAAEAPTPPAGNPVGDETGPIDEPAPDEAAPDKKDGPQK